VLTDRGSLYLSVALWNLTVPLCFAAAAGVVVTAWQGLFFIAQVQEGRFSWQVLTAAGGGAVVAAVAAGLLGGLSAARAARRWRPVAD
jgi:hypothetical protein